MKEKDDINVTSVIFCTIVVIAVVIFGVIQAIINLGKFLGS